MKYIILDKPFRSKRYGKLSFWRPKFTGYTTDIRLAGLYTLEEIQKYYNYPHLTDKKDFSKKENEEQCFIATLEEIEKIFGKAELSINY